MPIPPQSALSALEAAILEDVNRIADRAQVFVPVPKFSQARQCADVRHLLSCPVSQHIVSPWPKIRQALGRSRCNSPEPAGPSKPSYCRSCTRADEERGAKPKSDSPLLVRVENVVLRLHDGMAGVPAV